MGQAALKSVEVDQYLDVSDALDIITDCAA